MRKLNINVDLGIMIVRLRCEWIYLRISSMAGFDISSVQSENYLVEISDSYGDKYEDGYHLGCYAL